MTYQCKQSCHGSKECIQKTLKSFIAFCTIEHMLYMYMYHTNASMEGILATSGVNTVFRGLGI